MSEEKTAKGNKGVIYIILGVVIVASIAVAGYFYMQYQHSQQLLQNPTLVAQQQTQDLLTRVGKLIVLPKDETPTVATVSDVSKLQNQPFFAKATNGDKVLIYTKAKEAILYDPTLNIIVAVAPVNIGNNQVSPTPAPTVSAKKVTPKAPTATPTQ